MVRSPAHSSTAALSGRFVSRFDESGATAADAWFVDGDVLDNAPFDLVLRAIGAKRAQSQVQRRLVYIQPDPGRPPGSAAPTTTGKGFDEPNWAEGVRRAVLGVKGTHGVLRVMLALRDVNLQIAQVGAIVEAQQQQVLEQTRQALSEGDWTVGSKDAVQGISDRMHVRARTLLGLGYPSYCRLEAAAAVRRLANEIATFFVYPPDSGRRASCGPRSPPGPVAAASGPTQRPTSSLSCWDRSTCPTGSGGCPSCSQG